MPQLMRTTRNSCASFHQLSLLSPLLQFHPKRANSDAQRACGLDPMPAETLERAENHLLLDISQRFAGKVVDCAVRARQFHRPQPRFDRRGADHAGISLENTRALNDVLELADVPR